MKMRRMNLRPCTLAILSSAVWLGCGAKSDGAPGPDSGADTATQAGAHDGSGPDAGGAHDGGLAPEGAAADMIAGEASAPSTGSDGAADARPSVGAGDAATDTGSSDGPGDAIADSESADAGAEASGPGCSMYCAAVMAACGGGNAQYKDSASCMTACQYFPLGTPGQSSGDTLACRITHAGYAMTAPNPHCWHAGPLGYGGCGALYEGFCDIAAGHVDMQMPSGYCSFSGGFDAGAAAYTSNSDCWLHAAGFPKINMPTGGQPPGYVGLDGGFSASGPTAGDTLDCRAYHLVLALQGGSMQQTECPNVGWTSSACR
jgi:hypothetical protein